MNARTLAAAVILLPAAAFSQTFIKPTPNTAINDVTASLLGYAMPTRPLRAGLSELRVTPAYADYTFSNLGDPRQTDVGTGDDSGGGVAVSWTRAWNDHWGFSLFGAYTHLSGRTSALDYNCSGGGNCAFGSIPIVSNGAQAAATLIYDPFSSEDGFRFPLIVGAGALWVQFHGSGVNPAGTTSGSTSVSFNGRLPNYTFPGTDPIEVTVDQGKVFPGVFFGLAPQFNAWSFRVTPFFGFQTLGYFQAATYSAVNRANGTPLGSDTFGTKDGGNGFAGVTFIYRPWNLAFTYLFSQIYNGSSETIHMWNFTKAFTLGEPSPAY